MYVVVKPVVLCWLSILVAVDAPAGAETLSEQAAGIESMIVAENFDGALQAARGIVGKVWDRTTGLGFTAALLVAEQSSGYGIYNPRANQQYKRDEPVIIYIEPYGFGYGVPGEGLFAIGFRVDLKVMTETGMILADLPNLTELDKIARNANREFEASITYNLGGIDAGRYVLQTTLRDKNSGKIGVFENTVEITD